MKDHFPGSGNSMREDLELCNKVGYLRPPFSSSLVYEILMKEILLLTPG